MTDWATISPIIESFDKDWPWNFKWGFDAQTGTAHAWRIKSGTDGRDTHRPELEALWGREPKLLDGDTLGLASYLPAEKHLDGTVVAPPTILVQAYYGHEVPEEVLDWFHDHFPDATARKARLSSIVTGDMSFQAPAAVEPLLKWVWSKHDGLLIWPDGGSHGTHTHLEWGRPPNQEDVFGSVKPGEDGIEIEPASAGASVRAIQAVKDEVKQMYPDAKVTTVGWQQNLDAFHGDPGKLSAAWAQEHLCGEGGDTTETPLQGAVSDREASVGEADSGGWLSRFRHHKAADGPDMSGAMVALFLSEKDAKKVKIRGGEPPENIHITLCYFQDKADERDDWGEVTKLVQQIAKQTPKLKGKISGYGVFSNDVDVLWASPSVQGLAELRHKIYEACEDAGFHVDTEHDWVPHLTLKYAEKESDETTDNDGGSDKISHRGRVAGWMSDLHSHVVKDTSLHHGDRDTDLGAESGLDGASWSDSGWLSRAPYVSEQEMRVDRALRVEGAERTRLPAQSAPDPLHQMRTPIRREEDGERMERLQALRRSKDERVPFEKEIIELRSRPEFTLSFNELTFARGNDKDTAKLTGNFEKQAGWGAQDWDGWQGPSRFVTDGKEISTEPISEWGLSPDDSLKERFRRLYPESEQISEGWVAPTADDMGYGAWHQSGDVPLHELNAILDKHLEKPTHLVDAPEELEDTERYRHGLPQ